MKIGIYGPRHSRDWRRRWAEGEMPRFYTRSGQRLVDALYHRLVLESEGIPGGAHENHFLSGRTAAEPASGESPQGVLL